MEAIRKDGTRRFVQVSNISVCADPQVKPVGFRGIVAHAPSAAASRGSRAPEPPAGIIDFLPDANHLSLTRTAKSLAGTGPPREMTGTARKTSSARPTMPMPSLLRGATGPS